jgi:predicted DNA-binding ribbon-helix-helix protein
MRESKNILINSRRTSMRLEPALWELLGRIARSEGRPPDDVATRFVNTYGPKSGEHTSAVRVGIAQHFANAVEELNRRRSRGTARGISARQNGSSDDGKPGAPAPAADRVVRYSNVDPR